MPNRIPERLWPVEYWQNKKKQFMAGTLGGRRVWLASGLGGLALLFAITVTAGILTARPHEQARQIPLRPVPESQLLQSQLVPAKEPSAVANKPVTLDKAVSPVSEPMVWPAIGNVIQDFGWQQHPVLKDWRYHTGVDLSCEQGQAVKAALSGEVVEVSKDSKTGLTVILANGPWRIQHGSLAGVSVKRGDRVSVGQSIGEAGTSFYEPYPHVHISIEKSGQLLSPEKILPSR